MYVAYGLSQGQEGGDRLCVWAWVRLTLKEENCSLGGKKKKKPTRQYSCCVLAMTKRRRKKNNKLIYSVICFAFFCSFVGTVNDTDIKIFMRVVWRWRHATRIFRRRCDIEKLEKLMSFSPIRWWLKVARTLSQLSYQRCLRMIRRKNPRNAISQCLRDARHGQLGCKYFELIIRRLDGRIKNTIVGSIILELFFILLFYYVILNTFLSSLANKNSN